MATIEELNRDQLRAIVMFGAQTLHQAREFAVANGFHDDAETLTKLIGWTKCIAGSGPGEIIPPAPDPAPPEMGKDATVESVEPERSKQTATVDVPSGKRKQSRGRLDRPHTAPVPPPEEQVQACATSNCDTNSLAEAETVA